MIGTQKGTIILTTPHLLSPLSVRVGLGRYTTVDLHVVWCFGSRAQGLGLGILIHGQPCWRYITEF